MDARGPAGHGHLDRDQRQLASLQRRPRRRQLRVLPSDRPRPPARALALPAPLRRALGARRRGRCGAPAACRPGRCIGCVGGQAGDHVARQGPERRRRLRQRAGAGVGVALHRVGVAGPRGGRSQPARRRAARAQRDRLHPRRGGADTRDRRGGAHDPRARGRRPVVAALRGPGLHSAARALPPRRRLVLGLRLLHRLRDPRAARCRVGRHRCAGGLAGRKAERRRGLRAVAGRAERRRQHRRGDPGAGGRGPARLECRVRRRRLPAQRPERRRRLRPVRGTQLERAVDRLRGAGPRRGRPQPRPVQEERPLADRVPALAAEAERQRRLLARELADAGVGDRPGRDGAEAEAVPVRRGAARAGALGSRGGRRDGRARAAPPVRRRLGRSARTSRRRPGRGLLAARRPRR